jgi:hypothetical protein
MFPLCSVRRCQGCCVKLSCMNQPINMHGARTALNRDPKLRQWAEQWLKKRERPGNEAMTNEEFDQHWLNVRPERMHEGAIEAVAAYIQEHEEH